MSIADPAAEPPRRAWRLPPQLMHFGLLSGAAIVLLFVVVALVGPLLAPHDPLATDMRNTLAQPGGAYPLGTDRYGRDVLSRLLWGARASLLVAFAVGTLSLLSGVVLGTLAGFAGGWTDRLLLALINVLLAFPGFLLALAFVAVRGSSLTNVVLAVTLAYTPRVAIVMRAVVQSIRPRQFIEASYAVGVSTPRMIWRHVLPNALPPVIVVATVSAAFAILAEAGLSFLGLGVQPPAPTWGNVITEGRPFLVSNPWISISAGACIALVVTGLNLLGDGVRDTLDPFLRHQTGARMMK